MSMYNGQGGSLKTRRFDTRGYAYGEQGAAIQDRGHQRQVNDDKKSQGLIPFNGPALVKRFVRARHVLCVLVA